MNLADRLNELVRRLTRRQRRRRRLRRRIDALREELQRVNRLGRRYQAAGREVPPELREHRREVKRQLNRAIQALRNNNALIRRRRAQALRVAKLVERRAAKGRVIKRSEWGAVPPRGPGLPNPDPHTYCQHHTATPTLPATATVEEESATMRSFQAHHMAIGMIDIAYARVTFPSGRTYEGRDPSIVGAGAIGHNTGYAHAAIAGNYEVNLPTTAALSSTRDTRQRVFGTCRRVIGHDDVNQTACPGTKLKPRLKELG